MELARRGDRGLRVVGEERRDLERYPAVDAVGALEDRKEQIGACPRSSCASAKKSASPDLPSAIFARIDASYAVLP
jgi:hypothetical protein